MAYGQELLIGVTRLVQYDFCMPKNFFYWIVIVNIVLFKRACKSY